MCHPVNTLLLYAGLYVIIIMMIVIVIVILGDDSDGALQLERVSSASAALERCLVT